MKALKSTRASVAGAGFAVVCLAAGAVLPGYALAQMSAPRTYGVEFGVRFRHRVTT